MMFGTYRKDDVTVLLKDITGLVAPLPTKERERLIQSGVHYSAMLPVEYEPTEEYMRVYNEALRNFAPLTAAATVAAAKKILAAKGKEAVLVSLARAGTPVGILLKRCLRRMCGADVPHFTISIVRGRGIDENAVNYILARHDPKNIVFVDGWTGKGAIRRELYAALKDFPQITPCLAVLADPAGVADIFGTRDDLLIPSSCLNSTVSGLLSRTFLRGDVIGANDFHGAAFYRELIPKDLTYQFIDTVAGYFAEMQTEGSYEEFPREKPKEGADLSAGLKEVNEVCRAFDVADVNLVKPGIGEATRVLLRRVPRLVLVRDTDDFCRLGHIYRLAKEKNAPLVKYPLKVYRACGIIAAVGDM